MSTKLSCRFLVVSLHILAESPKMPIESQVSILGSLRLTREIPPLGPVGGLAEVTDDEAVLRSSTLDEYEVEVVVVLVEEEAMYEEAAAEALVSEDFRKPLLLILFSAYSYSSFSSKLEHLCEDDERRFGTPRSKLQYMKVKRSHSRSQHSFIKIK